MSEMSGHLDDARERLREQMASAPAELLDVKGAAQLLNLPASWIAAEARANRIPHVRFGRYVRYEPDELRAWYRQRARGPRIRGAAMQ